MLKHPWTRYKIGACTMTDIIPQDDNPRKQCTGPCGQMLPATLEFFGKHSTRKDRLRTMCKECRKGESKAYNDAHVEQRKQYHQEHKEEINEKSRQYHRTHREEIIPRQREYHKANREHLIEHQKRYYAEHREQRIEAQRQSY